jgi:hypothetical protein
MEDIFKKLAITVQTIAQEYNQIEIPNRDGITHPDIDAAGHKLQNSLSAVQDAVIKLADYYGFHKSKIKKNRQLLTIAQLSEALLSELWTLLRVYNFGNFTKTTLTEIDSTVKLTLAPLLSAIDKINPQPYKLPSDIALDTAERMTKYQNATSCSLDAARTTWAALNALFRECDPSDIIAYLTAIADNNQVIRNDSSGEYSFLYFQVAEKTLSYNPYDRTVYPA